jgi:hypothetical protein
MKPFLLSLLLALGFGVHAQSPFTNETNKALEKVIRDYPFQFQHIKDKQLSSNGQIIEFASKITIPEALACTVIEHQVPGLQSVSWEARVYTGADFTGAGAVFKQLYNQIKNTIVKLDNEKPIILNGTYETPLEKNNTTSVLFDLLPQTGSTQHLKVDLMMLQASGKWTVVLSVYDGNKKIREQMDVVSSNDYE